MYIPTCMHAGGCRPAENGYPCLSDIHTYMITSHQPFTVTFTTKVIEAYSQLGRPDPRPSCPCAARLGIPLEVPGQGLVASLDHPSLGVIAQPGLTLKVDRTSLDSVSDAFRACAACRLIDMHLLCGFNLKMHLNPF
jgi:hypothetical protein